MSDEPAYVLDASALLAFVHGEPGQELVTAGLERGCWMSTVNWSEVVQKLARVIGSVDAAEQRMWSQPAFRAALRLYPFDAACALETARLAPITRQHGLSLADRACLALGHVVGKPVLTSDRVWSALDLVVEVRQIR